MKRITKTSIVMLGAVGAMIALTPPALAVNDVRIYYNTLPPDGYAPYPCDHGHVYQGIVAPQYKVVNNCDVRVWLYENPDGTGYNRCISPGDTIFPNREYLRLKIGTSTNIC
jgi:hypothetical protein